jgi:hypothetical protein
MGSCEPLGFIKSGGFLAQLSYYYLLKNESSDQLSNY